MRPIPVLLACLLINACVSAPPVEPGPEPAGPARPPALRLPVAEELAFGNPAARVALVVVSDFQCPYCRRLHQEVLPAIKARYVDAGVVRLYHKDFPLPMHRQAFPAAVAARCAARQGQLVPMQNELYRAPALRSPVYAEAADGIGLDAASFAACMQDPSVRAAIDRERMELRRLGVTSTPTVVLGYLEDGVVHIKRMAAGTPTVEQFSEEIDALLAR
jgi:protein-disulfide isomerase